MLLTGKPYEIIMLWSQYIIYIEMLIWAKLRIQQRIKVQSHNEADNYTVLDACLRNQTLDDNRHPKGTLVIVGLLITKADTWLAW